ncbi:hypothetical protein CAEBREN_06687 [Caenorhabditis brenneri]|uniref:Uncharacterized protein n=1 Tax=Caenorhabditis brenneri TaxID=135651 RepID=G0N2R0_CAEBE|nr:hypothetical protein CAEBREN_06687 [Caenorhabditis brenneri]
MNSENEDRELGDCHYSDPLARYTEDALQADRLNHPPPVPQSQIVYVSNGGYLNPLNGYNAQPPAGMSPATTSSSVARSTPSSLSPDQKDANSMPKRCEVCGDKSTGHHYGVSTCEGCKLISPTDQDINKMNAWQIWSGEMANEIRDIVLFVKNIPNMEAISQEDKAILLKKNTFLIFFLRFTRALSVKGLVLRGARLIELSTLQLMYGQHFTQKMLAMSSYILSTQITDTELALFIVLVFVRPVSAEFQLENGLNRAPLARAYELFKRALVDQMGPGKAKLLLDVVPELEKIDDMHCQIINKVFEEYLFLVEFDPLVLEIFKVPRAEPIPEPVHEPMPEPEYDMEYVEYEEEAVPEGEVPEFQEHKYEEDLPLHFL